MASVLKLKKSSCMNCYKCIRHCPVKSIRFSANQAHIVSDECILCGQCFVVCPQNAKEIVNDLEKAKYLVQSSRVVASIAPSFIANFNGIGIESIREALKKLGFIDAEETAVGATIVKKEYEKMLDEEKKNVIISSCCHSVNLLIQKHFPDCLPYLADVVSPMYAHCEDIKSRHPECKTIFIGPCVAKKDEALRYPDVVDCVLTFEELSNWLNEEHVILEEKGDHKEESKARLFPTSGGVIATLTNKNPNYNYLIVDGAENCIAALKDIQKGNITNCFIEMSSCHGSCINGPVIQKFHNSPIRGFQYVENYAGKKDFNVQTLSNEKVKRQFEYINIEKNIPNEMEIKDILKQMGKTKPEDELNCGSCGYNTCREKAIAIFQGKATYNMCLPFLSQKAQSFSDTIISNTPNAILVVNDNFEIQQINKSALKILNLKGQVGILGDQVIRILDPNIFFDVLRTNKDIHNKRTYLAEYEKYVDLSVMYDKTYHVFICIMRDVTDEEINRRKKEDIRNQTVEIADNVVAKQMKIVQEIASLLGETTAETKIALTKLKEQIKDE